MVEKMVIAHYVNDNGLQARIITKVETYMDDTPLYRSIEIEFIGHQRASSFEDYDTEDAFEEGKRKNLSLIEQWAKEHGYYKFLNIGNPSENPTYISVGFLFLGIR